MTGEEAIYVNKPFTRQIVGLKQEESGNASKPSLAFSMKLNNTDVILNFLNDHIAKGGDFQARVKVILCCLGFY